MGSIDDYRTRIYIAGDKYGSSIAPPAHDYLAQCLGKTWNMAFLASPDLDSVVSAFRRSDFAGGVVTMPYKSKIIPYLDGFDRLVSTLGACNVVYLTSDERLYGTNTDWIGIKDALLKTGRTLSGGQPAMVYGAGGASRAAVHALAVELKCKDIYVVNRDEQEVADLFKDLQNYEISTRPNTIHVRSLEEAKKLVPPYFIVSTIPDVQPVTLTELEAKAILVEFLSRPDREEKGVMLDMCYHPRLTQNLKLALEHRWTAVDGVQVVAHQLKEQWRFWTGQELSEVEEQEAWKLLHETAERDETVTVK